MVTLPVVLERRMLRRLMGRMPTRRALGGVTPDPLRESLLEDPEKRASVIADVVLWRCKIASLSPEELEQLSEDTVDQYNVHGEQGVHSLFGRDAQPVLDLLQRDSSTQSWQGLGGGLLGGLLGAVAGAASSAVLRGRERAPMGAAFGVGPGMVVGFHLARQRQKRKEIEKVLQRYR